MRDYDRERMIQIPLDIFVMLCDDYKVTSVNEPLTQEQREQVRRALYEKLRRLHAHDTYADKMKNTASYGTTKRRRRT